MGKADEKFHSSSSVATAGAGAGAGVDVTGSLDDEARAANGSTAGAGGSNLDC